MSKNVVTTKKCFQNKGLSFLTSAGGGGGGEAGGGENFRDFFWGGGGYEFFCSLGGGGYETFSDVQYENNNRKN